MSLPAFPVNLMQGKQPCKTKEESWTCPNMKARENDTDLAYEHYDCKVCGRHVALDYDEMR